MTRDELIESFEQTFYYQSMIGHLDFTKVTELNQDPKYTQDKTYWMWLAYMSSYENHVGSVSR